MKFQREYKFGGDKMRMKKLHIDQYIQNLLMDKNFFKDEYRKFLENNDSIQNITGNASSDSLYELIKKAKRNKKYQDMLVDVLYYVDKDSITEDNFRLLTKFSKLRRNTFLASIAHTDLAFYQMVEINRLSGEYEAFTWLFDKICCNDIFTEEDMRCLLRENKFVTIYGVEMCIEMALKKYGNSKKIEIAEKMKNANKRGKG